MIYGMGVDIIEIARVRSAIERWGRDFLDKIFTPREIAYSNGKKFPAQHFAARFAAKEAVVKAFGEPRKYPVRWTDIEVLNDLEGKPVVEFRGDARKFIKLKKIDDVIISMSHSDQHAIANAILIKGRR